MSPQRAPLKELLKREQMIVAPGVYDLISAHMANQFECDAVFYSGYWGTASQLGLPDAGIATYRDFVTQIERIARVSTAPLIADADTGFGGLLNLQHTVRGYEGAGAAAITIEDQVFPKKCGHSATAKVVSTDVMQKRIEVALNARSSNDFLVIARTDARKGFGLDEAISRARLYADTGADLVFIEGPQSADEMAQICKSVPAPCVLNYAYGTGTKWPKREGLVEIGYKLILLPSLIPLLAIKAMEQGLKIAASEDIAVGDDQLFPFTEFNKIIGFPDILQFESQWSE